MDTKKKVLFVTQAMDPYTELTEIAQIARTLPQKVQEGGMEIRILMPRFGTINERRHRLHEVVRLSGMNIIVDDDDYPLIIKVASLPNARMQVYFLDNEDFFKRKQIFRDKEEKPFEDNPDRMVFFCKGVMETVKKFGWPPDVVFCQGWMTSLIPFYLKTAYRNEPLFQESKVVYALYPETMEDTFDEKFIQKASINNLNEKDLEVFQGEKGIQLHQGAISHSDAVSMNAEQVSSMEEAYSFPKDQPRLTYELEEDAYIDAFIEFFKSLTEEEVEK